MDKFADTATSSVRVFPFLCFYAKKQWLALTCAAIIAACVNIASTTVWPLVTGNLVDTFSTLEQHNDKTMNLIKEPLIIAFCFWIFMECTNRAKGFLLAYRLPKFEASIRLETFEYVLNHSHSYFVNRYIGAVAHRIDDLPRSARFIVDDIITVLFPTVLSIFISSSVMFKLNPLLSITFIGWLSCCIAAITVFCSRAAKYSSMESGSRAIVQGGIVDVIRNHLNVKIFNTFKHEGNIISNLQLDEVNKHRFSLIYMEKWKIVLSILNTIGVVCLFCMAIFLWKINSISVGDLTYVVTSTLGVLQTIWFATDELTYVFSEIGICRQSLSIINDSYDVQAQRAQSKKNMPALSISDGIIEFNDVYFKYPDNSNSFYVQKLCINKNETVGLVGFSGSCKTTFIQLLLRLFEIENGKITIDKQDIKEVDISSLRESIAFIQQDPILFNRTIMENIRYGNSYATDDEVLAAAKKAYCEEFINNLPEKFNTIVGEAGTKLSSGQKQRIAIARAILKNSKILLMDEATSALDSDTENEVQRGMEFLMREKTVIIIAHRLSTLTSVNRLLVFHEGRIVEDGEHKILLEKNGYYTRLCKTQNFS